MHPRRARLVATGAMVLAAVSASGCASEVDDDRQFDAARVRAATALLKVDPALEAGPAETIARTAVESSSTPAATLALAAFEPLDGGQGWEAVVRVEVEHDQLFGGPTTLERCYAYVIEEVLQEGLQVPHGEVECP